MVCVWIYAKLWALMGMWSPQKMRANHPISHNSPFPHRGFLQLDTWLIFFQQLFQPFLQYCPCLPIFCQCFPISCWVLLLHDLIHSQQLSQSWWLSSIYLFIFGCYLLSSPFISSCPSHITGQMSGHKLSITKMWPPWAVVSPSLYGIISLLQGAGGY